MYKVFLKQLSECKSEGMTETGEFQAFADHPEMMPAFNRKVLNAIKSGELKGLHKINCLRFGGECSSGHPQCRKLRNLVDKVEKPI